MLSGLNMVGKRVFVGETDGKKTKLDTKVVMFNEVCFD